MTKEDKNLLLQDLCGRLPYGVKIRIEYPFVEEKDWHPEDLYGLDLRREVIVDTSIRIEEFKPYLRPMSSMMQGEWEEMTAIIYQYGRVNRDPNNKNELLLWLSAEENNMPIILMDNVFSWLNKKMFDYRGLIQMGLALPAPEDMYNTINIRIMANEEKITGWVVREPVMGHFLTFFRKKPIRIESNHWVDEDGKLGAALADYKNNLFNEIQTETGPVKVELTVSIIQE